VKTSPSFGVSRENQGLTKTFDKVSVNHKFQEISSADVENCGVVKAFEEVGVGCKVNVNLGSDTTTCGTTEIFDNRTSIDSRPVLLKQTTTDCTLSAVQQTTRCSETDTVAAESGNMQEKNVEVQSVVGQLSGLLPTEELQQIYSRVFYRR